jgi:hypothetical protein
MNCGDDTNHRQKKHRKVYLKIAAECWSNSGDCSKAAEMFMKADEYTLAAQHYRRAEMFDQMIDVLRVHTVDIDRMIETQLMNDARKFYFFVGDSLFVVLPGC